MQQDFQAYFYRTNGDIIPITPSNKQSFTLGELKLFVKGHIEIISLKDGRLMILDEEGKLKHKKINELATFLAKDVLHPTDYIVGDVLVTPYTLVN
jgi:hypothetical protein